MKKMIMRMVLSCFFVFAILTSAVPFSVLASNSSDDVMDNVLDSLGEVDPHEDVVVSGVDNVTYEAGCNLSDSNITGNASNRSNDLEKSFRGNNSYLNDTQESVASWDSSNDTGATILPEVLARIQQEAASSPEPLWGLYAGVSNPAAVHHYSGTDTAWPLISGSSNLGSEYAVLCLVEYQGALYAGTMSTCGNDSVGRVYKYLGGTAWAPVGGTLDNQVSSLVVYNDNLYAGTAIYPLATPPPPTNAKLYIYDAPGTWRGVIDANADNLGETYPWYGFRSLYVWDAYLYLGDFDIDIIGRYNPNDGFKRVFDWHPSCCIYDFESYQNDIYASAFAEALLKSSDGVNWRYVIAPQWAEVYNRYNHMWELEDFQYHLYMGYGNSDLSILGPLGTTSKVVWRAPQGIISMTTDRLDQQLFIGTGAEAGYCCIHGECIHPFGSNPSGNGLVYMYDGTGAPNLISGIMGNGVQDLYWCHHEGYDQLKSFEDLLKSQAAALKSFENLLKAQFSGTLYVAHNDGATCYANGAEVFNSLAQPNAAYHDFDKDSSPWDHTVDISQYLRFGMNVVACEVQNKDLGSTSGGFDAAVEIDGNWVIPRGDDDMDESTKDINCDDNPLWEYWYDKGGGPPPIDINERGWYELNYIEDSSWEVGHSPLGDPFKKHNAFACTCEILREEDNKSHAFFRKSFDFMDPSLLFSFEFLLKKQAAALESFEDLLIAHWDELPLDAKTVLLESFEDLLMSQAEAILSFEELMKKLPVLPPPPSEEPIGVPEKPQSSPPESQSPSEMLFSAICQQYDTNNNDKTDREELGKAVRDCIAKEITREEFREITSSYFQGL